MLRLIGCNDVTRHAAKISVRAGFTENELSALWPSDSGWRLTERPAGQFTHCFVAQRVAGAKCNGDGDSWRTPFMIDASRDKTDSNKPGT